MRHFSKCILAFICLTSFSPILNAQIKLVDSRGALRDTSVILAGRVKYADTLNMLLPYLKKADTIQASPFYKSGGTNDAGNNKILPIYRNEGILTNIGSATLTSPYANVGFHTISSANALSSIVVETVGGSASQQAGMNFITKSNSTQLGASGNKGWQVAARADAWNSSGTQEANLLNFSYWTGSAWTQVAKFTTGGNVAIGSMALNTLPLNKLDVVGAAAIGSYAGVNTAPTNGLIISGNVGIGTSSPTSILDVQSAGTGNYTSVGKFLAPNNTTAGNATQINFGTAMSAGNNAEWRFIYQGNNSTTNRVDFGMNGYIAPLISYLVNGRVGIGNGSPSTKLDVVGTGKFSDTLYGTRAVFSNLSSGATTDSVVTIDATGVLKRINQSLFTTPVSATVSGIINNTALQELGGVDKKINGVIIGNGGGNSYLNLRVGYGAFNSNTTGTSNTALGSFALAADTSGSGNTALGSTSLNANTSGSNNTAVGQYAGRYLTTGSSNTFIGQNAGSNTTTGSKNTVLGNGIQLPYLAGSNQVAIGDGNGNIRLYSDSVGKVGIGTTSPATTLHINSSLLATNTVNANAQVLRLSRPSTNTVKWDNISQFNLGSYAVAGASTNDAFTRLDLAMNDGPNTTTSNIMSWTANGRVGIGTTAPGYPLHIYNGAPTSIYVESTTGDNNGMLTLNANTASNWANNWHEFLMFKNQGALIGSVSNSGTAAVTYSTTSDERLKENIRPTSFSIADLQKIQIKDFNYKSDKGTHPQTGVLAQQLYQVIPGVVRVGGADASINPWQVDYGKLTPYLIKAVQDQQQQIEQLEKKSNNQTDQIKEMNLQNQHLMDLIHQLEKRIQSLEKK